MLASFVAKLDSEGNHVFSKAFGDWQAAGFAGPAVDPAGNLLFSMSAADGSADFGGGPLSANPNGVYLVKLDSQGHHVFSKGWTAAPAAVYAIATGAAGSIVIVGQMSDSFDFGAGPIVVGNGLAEFMAEFDAAGNNVAGFQFGGSKQSGWGSGVAVRGCDVFFSPMHGGTLDLPCAQVPGPKDFPQIFLARFTM